MSRELAVKCVLNEKAYESVKGQAEAQMVEALSKAGCIELRFPVWEQLFFESFTDEEGNTFPDRWMWEGCLVGLAPDSDNSG